MRSNNLPDSAAKIANANAGLKGLKAHRTAPAMPPLPDAVCAHLMQAFHAQAQVQTTAQSTARGDVVALGAQGNPKNLDSWPQRVLARLAPMCAVCVVIAGGVSILSAKTQKNESATGRESPNIGHFQAPYIALKDLNLIALELNTTVVETQLSPLQLVRLGVPVNPGNTASLVAAQVLVSDSGEALAFKLDY